MIVVRKAFYTKAIIVFGDGLAPFLNVFGGSAPFREPPLRPCPHGQGRLQIWTKHLILTNFDDLSHNGSSAQGFLYKSNNSLLRWLWLRF